MRCPYCKGLEDKVVDSRLAEGGLAIRRRRECLECSQRFTTFERAEAAAFRVRKRSGVVEPYRRDKVVGGLSKACTNRPITADDIERVADEVEERLREGGRKEVPSAEVGIAILDRLREVDEVAYIRFASVYRDFQELTDFEKEVGILLQKQTPPKLQTKQLQRD
jgi:transcriptional repressor NrdR